MKVNLKYVVPMLAFSLGFGVTDADAAPRAVKESVGEIIFKIHDVVPEKNADGEIMYCNLGATFFNRTKDDISNLAISLVWNDDVISEAIDLETRAEREAKRNRSKEPKSRYSTSSFTSKSISTDLRLPPIKVNQQITLKTKVDTDRCFLLLNDMDIHVTNCGSLGVASSKEACANYFQYVSPKHGEYYTEFKEISWESKILQEDEQVSQLQNDVEELYKDTVEVLDSITNDVPKEEEVEASVQ